jgi:hypothetical protein
VPLCKSSRKVLRTHRAVMAFASVEAGTLSASFMTEWYQRPPSGATEKTALRAFAIMRSGVIIREQPYIVKQRVKISCCDRGPENSKRNGLPRS